MSSPSDDSLLSDERLRLTRYIEERRSPRVHPQDPVRRLAHKLLSAHARSYAAERVTDLAIMRERRRAQALSRKHPLRLHLGSARERKQGWVNIDLVGHPVDLAWNLKRPLPFGDESVDAIFHEHLLEHLSLADGLALTDECFRSLRRDGLIRIGVPDTLAYARAYVSGNSDFLDRIRPGRPTRLLPLQEAFYEWGHKIMYDFETLALLLRAAGFRAVDAMQFGHSRLDDVPDSQHRRLETVYVEAVK